MVERSDSPGELPRKRFTSRRPPLFPTVQADELAEEGGPYSPPPVPSRNEEPPEEGDWTAEVERGNQEAQGGDADSAET